MTLSSFFFFVLSFLFLYQIYQGLDIITNKVTLEEQQLVPHHLIDCSSPLTRWTVVDFQRKSLAVVSFIHFLMLSLRSGCYRVSV